MTIKNLTELFLKPIQFLILIFEFEYFFLHRLDIFFFKTNSTWCGRLFCLNMSTLHKLLALYKLSSLHKLCTLHKHSSLHKMCITQVVYSTQSVYSRKISGLLLGLKLHFRLLCDILL